MDAGRLQNGGLESRIDSGVQDIEYRDQVLFGLETRYSFPKGADVVVNPGDSHHLDPHEITQRKQRSAVTERDCQVIRAFAKVAGDPIDDIGKIVSLDNQRGGNGDDLKVLSQGALIPAVDGSVNGKPWPDCGLVGKLPEQPITELDIDQISVSALAAVNLRKVIFIRQL